MDRPQQQQKTTNPGHSSRREFTLLCHVKIIIVT